jgi:hypothetical protein
MICRAVAWILRVALVVVLSGCTSATSAPDETAYAVGATVTGLASGLVDSLPSGSLFVRVQSFVQPPSSGFSSAKHNPGFIYQAAGAQRIEYVDGVDVDISSGQATFLTSTAHSHLNRASEANHWYAFALWPSVARSLPPVNPLAQVAFDSEDLQPNDLRPGPYVETLQLITLEADGRSSSQVHGGLEAFFVLQGEVTLHVRGQAPRSIGSLEGALVAPMTPIQVYSSSGAAQVLAFLATPNGQPFVTYLNQAV